MHIVGSMKHGHNQTFKIGTKIGEEQKKGSIMRVVSSFRMLNRLN